MNITIKNKNVHYVKKGTNPRILLLVHGWGGSSKSLENLQNLFSKNFTTYAIDLPGFGKSDLPDKNWGVNEYSELLVEFLKKLNINSCIYFGHSFGGTLGINIAAKQPELINKLILSAPSFKRTETTPNPIIKKLKQIPISKYNVIKKLYYKIFFPNSDLFKHPNLESNFRKIITEDLSGVLDKIKQLSLIIWGENDKYTSVKNSYILRDNIKNSKLIIYKNMGHKIPLAEPEKVFKDCMEFI